ncbi:TPA: hypothetical protein ACSP3M_000587 [Aeromonas veronii]
MIPETRFEQAHGVTAGKLSYALELMDKGDVVAARDVILEVQKTNEEQARVIDTRLYGAVRNLCESRRMDSRRFFALQQVLGLREIVRSLLVSPAGVDLISMHVPVENDFFVSMLSRIPQSAAVAPIANDNERAATLTYQNGNARLWTMFCEQQQGLEHGEGKA